MNVAYIPVRGGSKSIPLKNIKIIAGQPLIFWVMDAACKCDSIDIVYIATDSEQIRDVVEKYDFEKVRVIGRSEESASDEASTEFAMIEFANNYQFDNIVLIQATSPLLLSTDLDRGFIEYNKENTDSVFSVVRQKRFHWKICDGYAYPINYDPYNRPRRQEFEGYFVENGAFFITSRDMLLSTKNRMGGRTRVVEMDEASYFEIDEISDWVIIEELLKQRKINDDLK